MFHEARKFGYQNRFCLRFMLSLCFYRLKITAKGFLRVLHPYFFNCASCD